MLVFLFRFEEIEIKYFIENTAKCMKLFSVNFEYYSAKIVQIRNSNIIISG